mgnify:CR=1 FL=1
MHDRYFYFVNVFALLCVFVYGKKFIPILALSEISSLICYLHYFRMANDFFTPFLEIVLSKPVASVLMFIIFALVMLYTLNKKPTTKKIVVTTVASYLVSSFVAGVFYYNEFMSLFLQIYE